MLLIIELQESVVDRFAFKYFILEVVTLLQALLQSNTKTLQLWIFQLLNSKH